MPAADDACVALRTSRAVLPGEVRPAVVVARNGRITQIRPHAEPPPADVPFLDLGDLALGPGLVDSHVHVNEPGRTEWEGFATATRAAAAGGVTTIVDMPLNSTPPVTTVRALEAKRAAAAGQAWVDVAFWGGITSSDVGAVGPLVDAGVCGFKVFLADSGIEEFPPVDEAGLLAALAAAGRREVPVVVHAEAPAALAAAPAAGGRSYARYVASRPAAAEVAAVALVCEVARRTGSRAHVLHLSSADALPVLEAAARDGVAVTAESCPHYLSLAAEQLPDGATVAKCAPPIRESVNLDRLWDGVRAGLIGSVVSDHSPAPPSLKALDTGDFGTAWGGISGLQTQLPVVWTAARQHGVGLAELARLQSAAPAALAGLPAKGEIAVGKDADLVAWDPDATFVVDPARLLHRHALSPWAGRTLSGVVHATWVRGRRVDVGGPARGALLAPAGRVSVA